MRMAEQLRPRWGQPVTGIVSTLVFTLVAWGLWYVFSDPRGPVGSFPYPFVLYLAMMILVGVWQHMFMGDWPLHKLPQPPRGILEVAINLVVVWFVIHVIFYKVLGLGFNFLSQSNLNELAAAGQIVMPDGKAISLEAMQKAHFGQSAVVAFVLIGFFSYPCVTILFEKWPLRPSEIPQPQAGLLEFGWCTIFTLVLYTALIVPFWGMVFGKSLGSSVGLNLPWWSDLAGFNHVHWVFGWWEWMIVILFLTPNVWRMKPWSAIKLPQPHKGLVSLLGNVVLGFAVAWSCVKAAPLWLPTETMHRLANSSEVLRFLWYHAAEIAGFTLFPFLAWHHYFDDMVPMADKDSWGAFWFRTLGILGLTVLNYVFFYYTNFGHWGLGNHHMSEIAQRFPDGESLVWNFWWITPLLFDEWFFHKWPFYLHERV